MKIVGWIIWTVLLCIALSWTMHSFKKDRRCVRPLHSVDTALIYWLLLIWSFFHPAFNRFHLVWIAIIAANVSCFLSGRRAAYLMFPMLSYSPPPLPILLVLVGMGVFLLTP
jgi:hypothetical protein